MKKAFILNLIAIICVTAITCTLIYKYENTNLHPQQVELGDFPVEVEDTTSTSYEYQMSKKVDSSQYEELALFILMTEYEDWDQFMSSPNPGLFLKQYFEQNPISPEEYSSLVNPLKFTIQEDFQH